MNRRDTYIHLDRGEKEKKKPPIFKEEKKQEIPLIASLPPFLTWFVAFVSGFFFVNMYLPIKDDCFMAVVVFLLSLCIPSSLSYLTNAEVHSIYLSPLDMCLLSTHTPFLSCVPHVLQIPRLLCKSCFASSCLCIRLVS
ncbi:hypothetical protein F4775DRAFT_343926 [Biscogniauxia sp. FL1348]|nr:hypothetical protein F4775DRAFT_343926 [Biscogniauxia sp. FL1348]